MKQNYNLQSIVSLLLENEVGFELFYGENDSNLVTTTRAAILVDLAPAVRIDFGDSKHGTIASRIHIANNHKINVRIEDLVKEIKNFKTTKPWNTGANISKRSSDRALGLTSGAGTNSTAANGTLEGDVTIVEENGTIWVNFTLKVRNFVRALNTRQVAELEPTFVNVRFESKTLDDAETTANHVRTANKTYAEGEYIYPRTIIASTLGSGNEY